MVKGKPNKRHPHSKSRGKIKEEDQRSKRDEATKGTTNERNVEDKRENSVISDESDEVLVVERNNAGKDSSDKNGIENMESKKYGKRKIESNWHRYEEAEVVDEHLVVEEEYDETKDFDYIRQKSASALSHFKFKEEEDWEKEVHHTNDNDGSILGLNLAQLAGNLQQYGVEEKLSLAAMIPEECKYCINNVLQCTPKPPNLSCYSSKAINNIGSIQWSYEGIEKYKYSFKESKQNRKEHRVIKDPEHTSSNIKYNSQNDDDILDELLVNKISITNDSRKCSNESVDIDVRQAHHFVESVNRENGTSCNTNVIDKIEIKHEVNEDELDLDMLLGCDMESPVRDNKDMNVDGQTDSDLDQWLDEMLT